MPGGLEVVGEAGDGYAAVAQARNFAGHSRHGRIDAQAQWTESDRKTQTVLPERQGAGPNAP